MKIEEPENSLYASEVKVWLDEDEKTFRLSMNIGDQKECVTVKFDRRYEDGHPTLYKLLGDALQDAEMLPYRSPAYNLVNA